MTQNHKSFHSTFVRPLTNIKDDLCCNQRCEEGLAKMAFINLSPSVKGTCQSQLFMPYMSQILLMGEFSHLNFSSVASSAL